QRDTPTWTSPSRIRSVVGRLMRLHSFHKESSLACRLLRLRRQLGPHPKLNLHHRVRLHRKLRLHLPVDLKLRLHLPVDLKRPLHLLHLELEAKTNRAARPTRLRQGYGVASRKAATAASGRANPDISGTTSPSFRGARAIHPSQEMSDR